ncbi:MAG: hypothetical protein ACREDT_07145 [Methylocella sp.]
MIFESTGKAKDNPRYDMELRAFLPRTYNLKAIADFETGPGSQVSGECAREAIQTARRFVERVTGCLPANGRTTRAGDAEPKP